jgi:putative tryptophan/tyrosine transport system substrate-binding protein
MALQPRVQTMRRREFVTLLGSAAVTWPALARAQQSTIPTVRFLSTRSPDESAHQLAAFHRGLAENGYVENQNVTVEYRWAMGQYDQMAPLAAELVRRSVGVLVAVGGDPSAMAAKAATTTIPIVATFAGDPVKQGLVASLSRPGGNVTGISNLITTLEPKRFGLLRELLPQAATVGILINPNYPTAASQLNEMQEAAHFQRLRRLQRNFGKAGRIDTRNATSDRGNVGLRGHFNRASNVRFRG